MKHILNLFFLFFVIWQAVNLCATSVVYNFRIAQITKQPITEEPNNYKHTLIGLLFNLYQKKYNGPRQNFTGLLASYIHGFTPFYLRIDFAFSHITQKILTVKTFSGTQTDDLLLTAGCKITHNQKNNITLSTLLGIPTHDLKQLQHPDFGSSQVGLGWQLDGIYNLNSQNAAVYGARYLFFVPRYAHDAYKKRYKISVGNAFDVLLAGKTNWQNQGIEAGYTARFQFGSQIYPSQTDFIAKNNCIRSNFYLVYKYKFSTFNTAQRLLLNIGYGFDHKPKSYGNKDVVTLWGSWSVNF